MGEGEGEGEEEGREEGREGRVTDVKISRLETDAASPEGSSGIGRE